MLCIFLEENKGLTIFKGNIIAMRWVEIDLDAGENVFDGVTV